MTGIYTAKLGYAKDVEKQIIFIIKKVKYASRTQSKRKKQQ